MAAGVIHDARDLAGSSKLLIFGGSFDPPHHAHIALPRYVRRAIGADWLVYVPAARSPFKRQGPATSGAHRLAMLQAALAEAEDAVIDTDELDRAQADEPSYTVDTLERMREQLGEAPAMRLLIGADQVPVFTDWHRAERIEALAEPVVMVRPPQTKQSLLDELSASAQAVWGPRIVEVPAMDLSATTVRRRLAHGQPIDDLVPAAVARYIEQHELYQDAADSHEEGDDR